MDEVFVVGLGRRGFAAVKVELVGVHQRVLELIRLANIDDSLYARRDCHFLLVAAALSLVVRVLAVGRILDLKSAKIFI